MAASGPPFDDDAPPFDGGADFAFGGGGIACLLGRGGGALEADDLAAGAPPFDLLVGAADFDLPGAGAWTKRGGGI